MKIEWDDRVYDVSFIDALMSQAQQITAYAGCKSMAEWEALLIQPDDERFPRAITGALWLMLTQDGQNIELGLMDPPFLKFYMALATAVKAEADAAAAAAEADPTSAAAGSGGRSARKPAASAG